MRESSPVRGSRFEKKMQMVKHSWHPEDLSKWNQRKGYNCSSIPNTLVENRTALRGVAGLVLSLADEVMELARPREDGKLRGR